MKYVLLFFAFTLAACNVSNETLDSGAAVDDGGLGGGGLDGGATMQEASSTDVCHKQSAECSWDTTPLCRIMSEPAVGGGIYKVERIELATEEASPYNANSGEAVRPQKVAYITMALTAYIWGKQVDKFTGRLDLYDDCDLWVEEETFYHVGDVMILTLYPDPDLVTYKLFNGCMQKPTFTSEGKASYGCIGLWNGLTAPEIQAIFEKAKKPDGTYDCTIPEGQCDYWFNPKDGGT